MIHFKIESGVAIPPHTTRRSDSTKYPWNEMRDGDSFFVPGGKKSSISAAASTNGKKLSKKFIVRPTVENDVSGVRVWYIGLRT